MSDPENPEEETAAEPVKVKQVAIAAGLVAAALTAAVAFTVAGPLGVGIAAAGVAGSGYAAHRIRNPRKGTLLQSWLTRTRKTKTGGTLTWPFTGSQQRRGSLTRTTRTSPGGRPSSKSRLPSLTSTRAKRSAGLTGTRSRTTGPFRNSGTGTKSGRRPSTTTSAPLTKRSNGASGRKSHAVSKPGGKPTTPTRTPAKLSKTRPLTSTTRGRSSTTGRSGKWPGTGGLRGGKRGATSRPGGRGIATQRPGSRSSTRGKRSPLQRIPNPFRGTGGGSRLGGRSPFGRSKLGRASRLGNPLGSTGRRDRNRDRTPNRTRLRPRPYARRTTGQLLRTSLRVPKRQRGTYGSRNGWRPFVRPNLTQAKRARRTLRLRSGVWLRRGAVWVAKTPARRWDRFWAKLPQAPKPLTHYTERAGMKVPSGPKTVTKPGSPVPPSTTPINRKAAQHMANNPNEIIMEAFQQMAAFQPSSAREVEEWLQQHHETLQAIGHSYGVLSDRMRDGMPFAAPVADSVREIGVALAAAGGIAQSAHQTLRVAHEADIRRYEDPRPGEDMWNPEKNR